MYSFKNFVNFFLRERDIDLLLYLFIGCFFFGFLKDVIYLFWERERNINVWLPLIHPPLGAWPATQACALTGN